MLACSETRKGGCFVTAISFALSPITCRCALHGQLPSVPQAFDEFTEFVRHYMGAPWQYAAGILSAMVMLGACIVYHILMQVL